MLTFDILWNKDKVRELIHQDNTIKKSVMELIWGTALSVIFLAIFVLVNFLATGSLSMDAESQSGLAFIISYFFITTTITMWVNAFIWMVVADSLINQMKTDYKAEIKNRQKDYKADILIVVNRLNKVWLGLLGFLVNIGYGAYTIIKMFGLDLTGHQVIATWLAVVLFILILLIPVMASGLLLFFLALVWRMENFMLNEVFDFSNTGVVTSWQIVIMASILAFVFTHLSGLFLTNIFFLPLGIIALMAYWLMKKKK